ILDATFSARRWRDAAADLARAAGARFVHLETAIADRAVLRARLAARRATPSVSDATDVELETLADRREPFAPHELRSRVTIDTGRDPAFAVASATRALDAFGVRVASTRQAS